MEFREATTDDLVEVSKTSISRGLKEFPESIDRQWALSHEGVVLGVGGIKWLTPTTAWAWMDWAKAALDYKAVAIRLIRDFLRGLMNEDGMLRLMAAVDPAFPAAVRTAEALGFKRESVMPKFFGDKPAIMYVLLPGE